MPSGAGSTLGTQSPPLEATGQDQPMGVTGMSGNKPQAVPDSEQRKEYFKGSSTESNTASEAQSNVQSAEKIKTD